MDEDEENNLPKDPEEYFGVHVSSKSFVKFLNCHNVSTTTIACKISCTYFVVKLTLSTGICQDHCMILYVYIGDAAEAGGVLTFYIPAMIDGED